MIRAAFFRIAGIVPALALLAAAPGDDRIGKPSAIVAQPHRAARLTAYTHPPGTAHDANQPVIARSVHLALDGKPLNDDYGVMFARGDRIGVDRVVQRGVAYPSPFYFADGSLGIIATRVDMAGVAQPGRAVLFKADRAGSATFAELATIDLPGGGAVLVPRASWDQAARRYVVAWRDAAGGAYWTTVADLTRTEPVTDGTQPRRIASTGNVGVRHDGAIAIDPGIAVDARLAAALRNRFGRIVNVGARVAPHTIIPGAVASLASVRATLDYSDGSTATRAVDWDAGDLRRLAAARGGTHAVYGLVRQRRYPRIFAYNRADPTIYRWEHGGRTRYLFVATDDTGNDNVGSVHLPIRVAASIDALADANGGKAREVDLLNRRTRHDRTAEGRTIAGCYWAPEVHEIGGRLSILFAPCFNLRDDRSAEGGDWSTVEAHIMQLRDGGDPGRASDWSAPMAVRAADGSRLGRPDFARNISLDMSHFRAAGQDYYIWSQRYLTPRGPIGDPLTWIARMDPARPARLASPAHPIIVPEMSFEENLAEGGFAVVRDGRVHLVYSSSGVSPTYVVGGAWAAEGADLTDLRQWHKWSAPLQKSVPMPAGVTDYLSYEQGPGHGAFTRDEDGVPLYVYHTWGDGVGGDGRDTRLRRVHWAADGRPLLDMTPDEEIAPAYRRVRMTVTIAPPRG